MSDKVLKWTANDIENTTRYNQYKIEELKNNVKLYEEDPESDKRKLRQICKTCFYLDSDKMYLQAFTHTNCRICGRNMTFPTSNIDKICDKCAHEKELCVRCGAHID